MNFDSQVEDAYNGPWSKSFRERAANVRAKSGLTFKQIGDAMDFSGAFVSNILSGKYNMGSQHCEKVMRGVQFLEIKENVPSIDMNENQEKMVTQKDLTYHIRAIKEAGGTVTF
ncbi:MAG: hypothetical protein ACR2F8_00295 [Caulobacteraceae bacterium]